MRGRLLLSLLLLVQIVALPVSAGVTGITIVRPNNSILAQVKTYNARPWVIFTVTTNDGYSVNDAQVGFWNNTTSSWAAVFNVSPNGNTTVPTAFYPMPATSGQQIRFRPTTNLPVNADLTIYVWARSANPVDHAWSAQLGGVSIRIESPLPSWSESIVDGTTRIRAIHFTELQTSVNRVRNAVGRANYSWAAGVTSGSIVKTGHITNLRTALSEAINDITGTNPSFTGTGASGTLIRGIHIRELRDATNSYP